MDTESKKLFISALEDLGYDWYPYSGRGMYMKECPAVTIRSDDRETTLGSFIWSLTEYILEDVGDETTVTVRDDIYRAVRALQTDNMGMDMVCYFPSVSMEGLGLE